MGTQVDIALFPRQRSWSLSGDISSAPNLLRSVPSDWFAGTSRPHRTADSRFSPPIRCEYLDSVVSGPGRHRTALARTLHFPRPCSCGRYLLVSVHSSGIDEASHEPAGTAMGVAACRMIPISHACWNASLRNV